MALVFQNRSNCPPGPLNGPNRLNGRSKDLGRAKTVEDFDIAFDVVSNTNGCAASDLIQSPGRKAWGVLYRLSKNNLERLREIEGLRYEEKPIQVIDEKRKERKATTFIVPKTNRREDLSTR